VKPAAFKYLVAETLDHALAVKAEHGDEAKFLAGGQSLIPAMNFRLAEPALLIDINALTDMAYVRESGDGAIRIGALTRQRTLERHPTIARHQPLVREAAGHVAHPQIRNRGTLCGNLAHADPASEQPAVLLALGARLRSQSASGERWIEARDFFVSLFTTALEEDEMLVEVELPALAPRTGTCFIELARRPGDYAMMGVAAVITLGEDGTCVDARLTYCNAGEVPVAADRAARSLVGERIGDEHLRAAGDLAREEISPTGNAQASEAFQRHLAAVLTVRAVKRALSEVGKVEVGG